MRTLAIKQPANDPAKQKNGDKERSRHSSPLSTGMPLLQRKCACGGGCPRCQEELGIQTKLKISEPGDQYEQEADRIADEVMRMPEPTIQRQVELEEEKTGAKEKMRNCRKNYLVLSWEKDTCCSNRGFPDPSAKNKKTGADCCNTFPAFVDNKATELGFDGAASCRKRDFLNHKARVMPGGQSSSVEVEVLCVDTRRKKEARVIELGYKAAQKAYGSTKVRDEKATVCIGDKEEAKTCYLETDCNQTKNPKESQCIPGSCSKTDTAGNTEKQDVPKK